MATQNWVTPSAGEPMGLSVLTHIVDRTDALRANWSGATEPVSRVPFQFWADTTAGVLKMRNAANTDWVVVTPLHAPAKQLLTFRASGALAVGELQLALPANVTVERLILVPDTSTASSVAASKEWGFMVRNVTGGVDLFSATPTTATLVAGVGGGAELVADAAASFVCDQNTAANAYDVLRVTVSQAGSPTAVADCSIAVVLSPRGL